MGQYNPSINGVPIKNPHSFRIEHYNITKSKRLGSGKMVSELVAKKRKFAIGYTAISGQELDIILSLVNSDSIFFTFGYYENGIYKEAICYAGAIPYDRFRSAPPGGQWYWKDLKFDIIEQ